MNKTVKAEIFDWVKSIILAVVLGLLIVTFVGQSTKVYGQSMEPTIHEGNSIFVEKISQRVDKLSKGEIIAFQSPVDEKSLIKRIIGIAGDKIEIKDGKVIVNGITLKEPYILGGVTSGSLSVVVPKNQLFVLGDNRGNSLDSRYFGCIDTKAVEGRAFVRYYPFNEIRTFGSTDSTK